MAAISAVYIRILHRELVTLGYDVHNLLSGTKLSIQQLQTMDSVDIADCLTMLGNARTVAESVPLGLLVGQHNHVGSLGALGASCLLAPTLRQGLWALENFSRLNVSYVTLDLISNPEGLSVRITLHEELKEFAQDHLEAAVMWIQNYVELLSGKLLAEAEFRFPFSRPPHAPLYRQHLHGGVVFDTEYASVELPAARLDDPSPYYSATDWNEAQLQLTKRLNLLSALDEASYTRHVTAYLNTLEPPLPDLLNVARALLLSERTLNRRLRDEGSSFRRIRSSVLQSWARRYLVDTTHSIEAIAPLLGYGDTANFRRAFRNWEGMSPGEYRRRETTS